MSAELPGEAIDDGLIEGGAQNADLQGFWVILEGAHS